MAPRFDIIRPNDVAALVVFSIFAALALIVKDRKRPRTTPLKGPPGDNWMFGLYKRFFLADDQPALHIAWAEQYGPAFALPLMFGIKGVVLCDPKACAHFHAKDTFLYRNSPSRRRILSNVLGKGILYSEEEDHRRQRRALTPAFSNASVRKFTPVFFDSAYKVKSKWDALMDGGDTIIEVQGFMNKVSLDSLGHAAFSHHFGSLDGQQSDIEDVFNSFSSNDIGLWSKLVVVISQAIPFFLYVPNKGSSSRRRLGRASRKIADDLLEREHALLEAGGKDLEDDTSILGMLIKSERSLSAARRTSHDEIIAQVKTFVLAGYETTSITLTLALIDLCRSPKVQTKLREELLEKFPHEDPSWDDLWYNLPYLDAVVLEVLRMHLPVPEIERVATEDDVIPLSRPVTTATGDKVTSLFIAKGTRVSSSIGYLNRSREMWGLDADTFNPERWLNLENNSASSKIRAQELLGHKHILTFSDGPRICLGKNFALSEIKSVLSVLIKNYTFEFTTGPNAPAFEWHTGLLRRPKLKGLTRAEVPLRIRKVDV